MSDEKTIEVCRFVRDAAFNDRRLSELEFKFGIDAVAEAIRLGYIEQQIWQGELSGYIDFTPKGSTFLIGVTLRDRPAPAVELSAGMKRRLGRAFASAQRAPRR